MSEVGRTLVVLGLVIVAVGLLLSFAGRLPRLSWLGHLPGDIYIKRENFTFYFPLTTSVLVSAVLTLVFHLLRR